MPMRTAKHVRVIRDVKDSSKDYWMDEDQAHHLFHRGKLSWDTVNQCYGEIKPCKITLPEWPTQRDAGFKEAK